jgi:transposase
MAETVGLTMGELDRLQIMSQVAERRLTRRRAAALLGLSERQVRRLYRAFRRDGAKGLASRHRGRPSNRRLATAIREHALTLVRERYADFGPTFAHQKLTEEHGLAFSVETLRCWMTVAGLWVPRAQRMRRSQPPRPRRACLGELVQIDGSEHAWFEDRGPVCTLLVYVDDATSRLMELAFAEVESTFDYFRSTRRYLERYGKPMAFYSDRLSVFHVHARDRAQTGPGLSQFGRALRELNIELLCARSPEAKGRVERANGTLQDRLVKELRLRGLNDPAAAAPFLPEFMADYNERFAKAPAVAYDAHRPLRPEDDLSQLFTLQETRRISRQLTVHYKRDLYVLEDSVTTRRLRGATVLVSEAEDGTVTLRSHGRVLPARLYPKHHSHLDPGVVVEYKHLDGVFAFIAAQQQERDAARLASSRCE